MASFTLAPSARFGPGDSVPVYPQTAFPNDPGTAPPRVDPVETQTMSDTGAVFSTLTAGQGYFAGADQGDGIWRYTAFMADPLPVAGGGGSGTVGIRDSHTFALQGAVTTAPVPGLFVDLPLGETVSLVKCRAMTGAGSVTFKLQRNGANVAGFGTTGSPLTATSTPSTTSPPVVSLAADNLLQLVIVGVTGSPTDLAVSVVLERTV